MSGGKRWSPLRRTPHRIRTTVPGSSVTTFAVGLPQKKVAARHLLSFQSKGSARAGQFESPRWHKAASRRTSGERNGMQG